MRLSYSLWQCYHDCPAKYKYKYLMKIKEPFTGAAAERGTKIHNIIEDYIRGRDVPLPWDATKGVEKVPPMGKDHPLQGVVDKLRHWPNGDRHVERRVGFDIDWEPWPAADDDAAFVVVFDAAACKDGTVEIEEWKSGKPYDSHADQRIMYAIAGLKIWLPKKVQVTTHYVDMTSPSKRTTVYPKDEQELKDIWNGRRETIINDKILAPRPNSKCQWCFYRKSNGGPCPMSF